MNLGDEDTSAEIRAGHGGTDEVPPLPRLLAPRSARTLAMLAVLASAGLLLSAPPHTPGPTAPADPRLVIDANTATAPILEALPSVGPVLAGRIVAEREVRSFASLDDLDARVRGIGPATASVLRPYLRFPQPDGSRSRP